MRWPMRWICPALSEVAGAVGGALFTQPATRKTTDSNARGWLKKE
jgi:hypothetical protein